jgi:hypothetical protein
MDVEMTDVASSSEETSSLADPEDCVEIDNIPEEFGTRWNRDSLRSLDAPREFNTPAAEHIYLLQYDKRWFKDGKVQDYNVPGGDVAPDARERRRLCTDTAGYDEIAQFWQEGSNPTEGDYQREDELGRMKESWIDEETKNEMTYLQIKSICDKITADLFGQGEIKKIYFLLNDSISEPLKRTIDMEVEGEKLEETGDFADPKSGHAETKYLKRGYLELRLARYILDEVLASRMSLRNPGRLKVVFDMGWREADKNLIEHAFSGITNAIELGFKSKGQSLWDINRGVETSLTTPPEDDCMVVSFRPTGPV